MGATGAVGIISALAAVGGATAAVVQASKPMPKPPKLPSLPQDLMQRAPDESALAAQQNRRLAAGANMNPTQLTGPLGALGTNSNQPKTLLGQ